MTLKRDSSSILCVGLNLYRLTKTAVILVLVMTRSSRLMRLPEPKRYFFLKESRPTMTASVTFHRNVSISALTTDSTLMATCVIVIYNKLPRKSFRNSQVGCNIFYEVDVPLSQKIIRILVANLNFCIDVECPSYFSQDF